MYMNVIMLKPTRWEDKSLVEGESVTVEHSVGLRWLNFGIAEIEESEVTDEEVVEEEVEYDADGNPIVKQDDPLAGPYEGMKAKELYELCISREIEAEARKSVAYYVELLEAADKPAEEPKVEE